METINETEKSPKFVCDLCDYKCFKNSDKYNKLVYEALGGKGDNDAEKEDKIIKNIAKEVIIDKE